METNNTIFTFLESLKVFWFYPLPHLAAFLLVSIPLEAYSLVKNGSKKISIALHCLSIGAVMFSASWFFFISANEWPQGKRFDMPVSYLLACLSVPAVCICAYLAGAKEELANQRTRLLVLRTPLFLAALFLYTLSFAAPYRVDRHLDQVEQQTQKLDK